MYHKFVIALLLVLPTTPYQIVCVYDACTISNIDINRDGLYAFSFLTNETQTLILKRATGKRFDFSFLQIIPTLELIVLEHCKFEELVMLRFNIPASLVLRYVSLKHIRFHASDSTLKDIRLFRVPFNVIPRTVLKLRQLVDLEQCRSRMSHLQLSVLRNLESLANLNLSYNKIRTVTVDTSGDCCAQLRSLNLVGNMLVRFNFGVLIYLQRLERVFLGHNHIATINTQENHSYLPKVEFCSWKNYYLALVGDNATNPRPPQCHDYFANLKLITLNHNRLIRIDLSKFERMNVLADLDLAFNDIKTIEIAKGRLPISLNMSELKGSAGYLHDLSPDVFSETQ
ncbi:uncharacterized protein LOC118504098 [Anopheles stephensi]|uniref:Leucine rich immune protein (Coil-less) n=1 Tax=Anopheles stephensi TaxID=30069 RepID=A0A182YMI2_ANOST|nr:uncharacterized protein LOC118504098 [Anopheles stephensi]